MALRVDGGRSGAKTGQQTKTGSVLRTSDNWHDLPDGFQGDFDAILNGGGPFAGYCYIFKGDSYIKYDWSADRAVPGYPKKIAGNWPGMPAEFCYDLDAAVDGQEGFAGACYFFKGDSYVKFSWTNDRAFPDCPKRVAGNWPGLPAGFEGGFDAAMNGKGKYAGKCYFFKGDSYISFDWKNDRADPSYPKKIADGWHMLPGGIDNGIDTAVDGFGPFVGKAYLFKGNGYVRYDWAQDRTD
jgi:hypothetical protein